MDSVTYNNVLPWRGCEKLYLNSRTADVHFIFHSEEIEKVPAHKSILSIISPAFDAMFYGPNKQDGDIEIVDASPEAFKEFLQFFYRSQVKLTAQNISEVLNLGRQYLLDDWQVVVFSFSDLCISTMTLDNMCVGYELAILYELDELKQFCEKKIGENAEEIFHSNSFLACQPNLLRHILQLETFTCDESTVFDGCMEWAKAECVRMQCDENNGKNLRAQLGELFYEIRFGDLSLVNFEQLYRLNEGCFSLEEFRDITMMIARKDYQPGKFNRTPRTLARNKSLDINESLIVLKREIYGKTDMGYSTTTTQFVSNSKILLKKISCSLSKDPRGSIGAKIRIHAGCRYQSRGTLVSFVQTSLGQINNDVELPAPILIEPGVMYEIDVQLKSCIGTNRYRKKIERLEDGTVIDFFHGGGDQEASFVSGFHFVGYKTNP